MVYTFRIINIFIHHYCYECINFIQKEKINESGIGRLALSSCPGKKVRLHSGPVNGRAAISRDLDMDFKR